MAAGEKVIPEITVGNQTYKLMDETAREHLVEVKSTTPTSEDNRLWIKEMSAAEEEANTYEVPTIDEFNDLKTTLNNESVRTRNLIDVTTLSVGELINGNYNPSGDNYVSDYFPVEPLTYYCYSGNCSNTGDEIAFYNANYEYIDRRFGTGVTSPANSAFARVEFEPDVSLDQVKVQFEKNVATPYQFAYEAPDFSLRKGIVTPEMFGAVGNGLTNDSDAFEAALAGGNVCLVGSPGKTYFISRSIALGRNTTLKNIRIRDNVTGTSVFYASEKENITFENIDIVVNTGTISYQSGKATLLFEECENIILEKVNSYGTKSSVFAYFSACSKVCVNKLFMDLYYEYGIRCTDETQSITITNCTFKNCDSSQTHNYAIGAYGVYGQTVETKTHNILISNNRVKNFSWTAIDIHGGYDIIVTNNVVNQDASEGAQHTPKIGINVGDSRSQARRIIVSGNEITGNNNAATYAIAVSTADDILIEGNIITNWSRAQSESTKEAVIFYAVTFKRLKCCNNIVSDFMCCLAYLIGRDVEFCNNMAFFSDPYHVSLFDSESFRLHGDSALRFCDNMLNGYKKFGTVRPSGSYNSHPVVKNNDLKPDDMAAVHQLVTSKDYITIEDFKYTDDEISGIIYGKLNDIVYSRNQDGSSHAWVCTKSFYTAESPAEWRMIGS